MSAQKIDKSRHLDWIEDEYPEMCKTLIDWAHINSGSHNTLGLAEMAQAIKTKFQVLDLEITELDLASYQTIDHEGNKQEQKLGKALSMQKRPDAELKILLVGHMDTVFGKDHSFQKIKLLDDNTLNGPGVADLKGGLIVMLKALEAFERFVKENPQAQKLGWEVLINPDEEIGSPGSAPFIEAAAKRNHIGLVFEPSLPDGSLVSERKGSGNFTLIIKGRAAHTGREFDKGRNAIVALTEFIQEANSLNTKIPGIILNIGTVQGGKAINVVPDLAICKLGIRTSSIEDESIVLEELNKILDKIKNKDGFEAELIGHFNRKPKIVDAKIKKLFEMINSCAKEFGIEMTWKATGGCCDGNNLAAAGLANLDTLGVRGANIHTDQEYVLLDSLTERSKIIASFLMQLANGDLKW